LRGKEIELNSEKRGGGKENQTKSSGAGPSGEVEIRRTQKEGETAKRKRR